jgi:hypothetical protein
VGSFRQELTLLPDKRTGKNSRYGMEDAALSAFSVVFTQTPSFVSYNQYFREIYSTFHWCGWGCEGTTPTTLQIRGIGTVFICESLSSFSELIQNAPIFQGGGVTTHLLTGCQ